MHTDLQELATTQVFHAAVCIVGGGVAGLTLARRLARGGLAVHLLEAGGLTPEPRSQSLYRAETPGDLHRGANEGRYRTFGGSSTQWGGQLLPFSADIFRPPAGSLSDAWPIDEAELSPYYDDIQRQMGVDALPFDHDLLPALGHPALPGSTEVNVRFAKWAPFGKRNLANTLGADALADPLITVFTHANAVRLVASAEDPARIAAVEAVNYDALPFRFEATHFVVCSGTIESSRLLLCSPAVPNPHDQLGRYFHDHLSCAAATLTGPGRARALELLGPFYIAGTLHSAKLEATPALRVRERLLAVMAHLVIAEPEDSGTAAIRNLLRSLQSGRMAEALGRNLLSVLRGTPEVARLWFYSRFRQRRAVGARATIKLHIDLEQLPAAESRIRLAEDDRDALGMPRTVIEWKIGALEIDTALRYAAFARDYLKTLGIASLDWSEWIERQELPPMADTYHMMGGLRMGTDPRQSVVDPDLRVHQLANLHIASCAVFPAGGSSNPTFTLMALALRLGDHLSR